MEFTKYELIVVEVLESDLRSCAAAAAVRFDELWEGTEAPQAFTTRNQH
jgi:hypothetical protein